MTFILTLNIYILVDADSNTDCLAPGPEQEPSLLALLVSSSAFPVISLS